MAERILFLTGHLARPRLEKVLGRIEDAGFDWSIFDVGVKVAALMWAMNRVVPSTQTCPPPGQSKCDTRVVLDWLGTKRSEDVSNHRDRSDRCKHNDVRPDLTQVSRCRRLRRDPTF